MSPAVQSGLWLGEWTTLANVLIGALISALVGFGSAWIGERRQRRRDQSARVYQERAEAVSLATRIASYLVFLHAVWTNLQGQLMRPDPQGQQFGSWQKVRGMIGPSSPAALDTRE